MEVAGAGGDSAAEGAESKHTHTHTSTQRSLETPASTTRHLPSRPDFLIDVVVKIKACGTPRDREREGKVATHRLP